jgi:hypothetical protein
MDSNVDLELMAALIDGRLAGEDRARAVKLLADSDEALELYAHAVRERYGTSDSSVVPIASRRGWPRWKFVIPIAAAAGLAIVTVPVLRSRAASPISAREYAMELGRDPGFVSGLTTGWEQRAWPVTRGAATAAQATRVAADSVLAFRLGVRSVDLQVALDAGDTALAARLIDDILDMLNSLALSAPIAERYKELRSHVATDARAESTDRASDAEQRLREQLGSGSFAFGQWVAAAELAARTHDVSFFQSGHVTRSIESIDGLSTEDRETLRSVDARMKQASTDRAAFEDADATLRRIIQRRGA